MVKNFCAKVKCFLTIKIKFRQCALTRALSINTKQHGVIHIVHIVRGPSRFELKIHKLSELKLWTLHIDVDESP